MRPSGLAVWLALAAAAALGLLLGAGGRADEADAAPWRLAESMSQRRSYIAAAQIGDRIYAAGGMVGETGRPLATFTAYDVARDEWTTLEPLPVPTRAAAAASLGGAVYVMGGTTRAGNTRAVWRWNGSGWRARAPLPEPRYNHAALTFAGRIYVLGGLSDGRARRDVFAYDPRRDRWARAPSLPQPAHAFGVVAFAGELWAIGGRRGERIVSDVWILHPRRSRWRAGPALPRPMELLGAAVAGDEIHAVWESTYQIYSARSGRWRDGPRPLVTRHALEAFIARGELVTVGGCTTALRDSPVVERRRVG